MNHLKIISDAEGLPSLENESKNFDWRRYVRKPEFISPDSQAKLDELAGLVNEPSADARTFWSSMTGRGRKADLMTLVQYFRDILTQEERVALLDDVEKSEPSRHLTVPDVFR